MKNYDSDFSNYLFQQQGYLATCWKIVRRDGETVGLTDFDRPLTIDGLTYECVGGFTPSDVDRNLGRVASQITLQSYFSDTITEADIVRGAYDGATVFVFRVNPTDLPTSLTATPYQYDPLVSGKLGRFTLTNQTYSVECRGLPDELGSSQGFVTSATCRNTFGDSVCGVDVAGTWTVTRTVQEVISDYVVRFPDTSEPFVGGILTWLTGDNTGLSSQIIAQSSGTLTLFYTFPNAVAVGDTANLSFACDKTFGTCSQRFGNRVNFQGEPDLPGQDKINTKANNVQ